MSRRLPRGKVKEIGRARTLQLTGLAVEEIRNGKGDRARRYVEISRAICAKTQTQMPDGFVFCRHCDTPLIPGTNCSVRLRNGMAVSMCPKCGKAVRRPYGKRRISIPFFL